MLRYAKKLLIADEDIKYYTKRSEIVTFYKPVLLHLLLAVAGGALWWASQWEKGWWFLVVGLLIPLPYSFYIWLWWVNKYYIVTTFRVLKVEGILNKVHRDASLDQINDLSLSEPFIGRLLGWGHLQVLTANEESGVTYHYIKHAVTFKKMVTTWKEHVQQDGLELRRKGEPPPSASEAPEDPISQIERLGELVKKGLLSREEFEKKKRELLDEIK
jgi:uncharacterized membrane protein YdbT with pleckstrin-like domain